MSPRFLNSLRHAARGLRFVWNEERNFRIHVCIAVLVTVGMIVFRFSAMEAAVISLVILMVLAGEIFNSLLEHVLDVIEPEHHVSVGRMKDMMAGVVLVLSIGAVAVGILVTWNHF